MCTVLIGNCLIHLSAKNVQKSQIVAINNDITHIVDVLPFHIKGKYGQVESSKNAPFLRMSFLKNEMTKNLLFEMVFWNCSSIKEIVYAPWWRAVSGPSEGLPPWPSCQAPPGPSRQTQQRTIPRDTSASQGSSSSSTPLGCRAEGEGSWLATHTIRYRNPGNLFKLGICEYSPVYCFLDGGWGRVGSAGDWWLV